MKIRLLSLLTLSLIAIPAAHAEEQGVDRAVDGAADAVASPGKIIEEIDVQTSEHGAVGVVTGSITGGAKAAGQAVKGAADVGVGIIEAVTEPLRD